MIAHIHHQYISTCDPKWIANLLVTLAENNHMVDCDPETQELMEQCVAKHSGTSDRDISTCDPKWIANLLVTLAENNHMVDCDPETQELMEQCVAKHSGTSDRELIGNASLYEITSLKRKYLTTIEVDGTFTEDRYLNLFGNPSLVLVENGPYEWPVYKMMIDVYKNDRKFKNIYAVLLNAVSGRHRTLQELHAGGNGAFEALIVSKEKSPEYQGLTTLKIYPVTDSDRVSENAGYLPTPKKLYRFFCGMNSKTDDVDRAYIDTLKQPLYHWHSDRVSENAGYLPTPKKLYRFFCGMNSKTDDVDRAYIDTLKQPLYHWHMWRKRAIENYFPPEAFEKINLNVDRYRNYSIPERYFIRVENEIEGYDKKNLVHVAESMSRNDYEAISDKLIIEGEEMSEIRLFLLKMAKVV